MLNFDLLQHYRPQRTTLFKVLCILSFIGGGLSILSNLFVVSLWDSIPEILSSNPMMQRVDGFSEMMQNNFAPDRKPMFITLLLLNTLSVVGVALMYQFKKSGIHCYIAAQIFLMIAPMCWLGFSFPFFDILITALFIYLYIRELKRMNDACQSNLTVEEMDNEMN